MGEEVRDETSVRDLLGLGGRRALVTGASGGIGRATVRALADAGMRVVATGRTDATVAGAEGYEVLDVADPASITGAVERARARLGGLDLVVNNAGITRRTPSIDVRLEDWEDVQDVNLRGTFLCCQAAARSMLAAGGGAIVNVSSQLAIAPPGGRASYVSSKAGVIGLTRTLAVEWAPTIRVNVVAPGVTKTKMIDAIERDPDLREEFLRRIPLQRFAEPEEIASGILYLASDLASYVTGHVLVIDGGYTIS